MPYHALNADWTSKLWLYLQGEWCARLHSIRHLSRPLPCLLAHPAIDHRLYHLAKGQAFILLVGFANFWASASTADQSPEPDPRRDVVEVPRRPACQDDVDRLGQSQLSYLISTFCFLHERPAQRNRAPCRCWRGSIISDGLGILVACGQALSLFFCQQGQLRQCSEQFQIMGTSYLTSGLGKFCEDRSLLVDSGR